MSGEKKARTSALKTLCAIAVCLPLTLPVASAAQLVAVHLGGSDLEEIGAVGNGVNRSCVVLGAPYSGTRVALSAREVSNGRWQLAVGVVDPHMGCPAHGAGVYEGAWNPNVLACLPISNGGVTSATLCLGPIAHGVGSSTFTFRTGGLGSFEGSTQGTLTTYRT